MTADLARITYDPTRQYRSVITQQGRVTLEADSNEAAAIASEALRLETIDIIGPAGTPDDGYKVGPGTGAGGVSIGAGTFYLGGWRLELDKAIDLSSQPELINAAAATALQGTLLVALLLTEQSVCAVEDQALREAALGGPDSAARMRLMQHFLRQGMTGDTCAAGGTSIAATLSAEGITIDPATLQLLSAARLQAGYVPGPANTDPCTPAAAGGYLGADNQLVRVTVIAYNATAKTGTLLWGWNNASLLYRASVTDPRTLTLTGAPVDEEHAPQLGQAVEILRSRANLGDGNFIAAPEGFVTTLTQAYSFDTGELGLTDALPADYQADKNPLFVRLWQAKVPFNAGQVTPLDSISGITVTLTLPALPTTIALRPYWRFAVRPATPVVIYPQRYQEAPQPPDGPRQWLADLAVVQAQASGVTVLADCRAPFVPLTQQTGGCCDLVLGPNDVAGRGGLQAVVDSLAGTRAGVSLKAGTYTLPEPLLLGKQHIGLTLAGCGSGVLLTADPTNLAAFRYGMILLDAAPDITLRELSFVIPNVPLAAANAVTNMGTVVPTNTTYVAGPPVTSAPVTSAPMASAQMTSAQMTSAQMTSASVAGASVAGASVTGAPVTGASTSATTVQPATSVGVLAVSSANLTVDTCIFRASPTSPYVYGAGLYLLGESSGVRVQRNLFGAGTFQAGGMMFGVLATVLTANASTALDAAEITDNVFERLTAGVMTYTQLGMIRCTGNRVVQCGTGLFFAASDLAATSEVARQASTDVAQSDTFAPAVNAGMQAPMLANALTQSAPFAAKLPAAQTTAVSDTARSVLVQNAATRGVTAYRAVVVQPQPAMAQVMVNQAAMTQTVTPQVITQPAAAPPAAPAQTAATPPAAPTAAAPTAAVPTAAVPAAVTADPNLISALDMVRDTSIAAEIAGTRLAPVLHIAGNDVSLIATGTTPGVGIAVVLAPRDDATGMVLMTANRVVTADTRTEAAAILFPVVAAVTGNVFLQTGDATKPLIPGFMLVAEGMAKIEVTANVIHNAAAILPARANPAATNTWAFLNTSG